MTAVAAAPTARRSAMSSCVLLPVLVVVSVISATLAMSAVDVRGSVLTWRPRQPLDGATPMVPVQDGADGGAPDAPLDMGGGGDAAATRRLTHRSGNRHRARHGGGGGDSGGGSGGRRTHEEPRAARREGDADGGPAVDAAAAAAIAAEEADVNTGGDDYSESAGAARVEASGSAPQRAPLDPQIDDDLRPWRPRGFTMDDIATTRDLLRRGSRSGGDSGAAAAAAAAAAVAAAADSGLVAHVVPAPGIFTITIWRRRVYALSSEARAVGSSLSMGGNWKIGAQLATLGKLARSHRLPDVTFLWNVDPTANLLAGAAAAAAPPGLAPLLSVCKTAAHWDVLVPNTYFRSPAVWNATGSWMERSGAAVPWANRSGRIWFRGASGELWRYAEPRVRFMAAWHGRGFTDFAFTNHFPSVWGGWQKRSTAAVANVPRRIASIRYGAPHKMPLHSVAAYRYALHLPGSYRASYSRALQYLLWTRTLVFVLDNPWVEFYYRALQPGVHYLAVNYTNLADVHAWAEAHPAEAEGIAAAGLAVARARLTGAAVAAYWQAVLTEYARLQRFEVKVPPPGSCACFFAKGRPRNLPRNVAGRCPFICDPGTNFDALIRRDAG